MSAVLVRAINGSSAEPARRKLRGNEPHEIIGAQRIVFGDGARRLEMAAHPLHHQRIMALRIDEH